MLASLALMAQTAALSSDPYDAARTCVVATLAVGDRAGPGFETEARSLYYLILAARIRPGARPLSERMSGIEVDLMGETVADTKAVARACGLKGG